jgi:hypothetical protein
MQIGTYKIEDYSFVNKNTGETQTGKIIKYYTMDGSLDLVEEFIQDVRQGYEEQIEGN